MAESDLDRLEEFDEDGRPMHNRAAYNGSREEEEEQQQQQPQQLGQEREEEAEEDAVGSPVFLDERLSREEELYVNQLLGVMGGGPDDLQAPPPTPTFMEQHLAIVYEDTDEDATEAEDDEEEDVDEEELPAAAAVAEQQQQQQQPPPAQEAPARRPDALVVDPAAAVDEGEVRQRASNLLERMRLSLRRAEKHAKAIAQKDGVRVRNPNLRVNTELAKKTAAEREKRRLERKQQQELREQQKQHQREMPIVPVAEEPPAVAVAAEAEPEASEEEQQDDEKAPPLPPMPLAHREDMIERRQKERAERAAVSSVSDRLAAIRLQEDFERIDRLRLEAERLLNECLSDETPIFVKNTLLSLSEAGGATARPMKLRALRTEVGNLALLLDTMPDAGGSDYMEGLLTYRAVQFLDRVRGMVNRRDFRAVPSSSDTIEDARDLVEMGASLVATICEAALMSEDLTEDSREHVLVVAESILSLVRHVVLLVVVRDDVVRLVVDLLSGDIVPDSVFADVVAIFFDTCATVMHFTMLHIPSLSDDVVKCKAEEARWIQTVCRAGSALGTGKLRRGPVYLDSLETARSHASYNALQQSLLMVRDATDEEKDAVFVSMSQLRSFHVLAGNAFRLVQPRAPSSGAAGRESAGGGSRIPVKKH